MRVVSLLEDGSNFESILDGVVDDAVTTVVTRCSAEPVVVMSLEHYNRLMELFQAHQEL